MNKKYKAIKVSTSSGKDVEITGKIDRIDVAKNADGTYVRIIDYKSSIKNIDLNKVKLQKEEVESVEYMSVPKIYKLIETNQMLKSHGVMFKELMKKI